MRVLTLSAAVVALLAAGPALALMPADRAWCLVGDLIQGVGTVVIHKPEGNMRRYFDSLQRMIDLDPEVIVPSHGLAMGTTFRLRETLRHRRQRLLSGR